MCAQVSSDDQARALKLVQELRTRIQESVTHVQGQIDKVQKGEWNTNKGISFLEVKHQMLLSYLINLTQLLCVKVKGQPISGNPAIERLVEIRTVLEKMRPIDQKLKYQIDKLLKTATTGVIGENDPLRFKPNPENLQSKFSDEDSGQESGEEEAEAEDSGKKVYRPPKLVSVAYDGDETWEEKKEKSVKKAQKKALSSSLIRELRAEYTDAPEEITDTADLHRSREDKTGRERTEYEEKYLIRTAVSKKEINKANKMRTITSLDGLTRFGDISALTGEDTGDGPPGKKRKKMGSTKKSKKAAKKWKRKK